MMPAAAVSGFYFSHPEARYFQVGRIGADQVLDYARRKGIALREAGALAGARTSATTRRKPAETAADRECHRHPASAVDASTARRL